jgi:hypothetical protein
MTTLVAAGRRVLPRGYADFARQLAIWFGFYVLYQVARGAADRDVAAAFDNGLKSGAWARCGSCRSRARWGRRTC